MKTKTKPSRSRRKPAPRVPIAWPDSGLVPSVVRDAVTGQVLVLAYTNRESLRKTLSTGLVHFWSRKRKALWLKGETSGNVFRLVSIHADCDRDALLFDVHPAGPACHTGAISCFFRPIREGGRRTTGEPRFGWDELHSLVLSRKKEKPKKSGTTRLFEAGMERIAQKLEEEAAETARAAKKGEPGLFIGEVADLVYLLTVLMASVGVSPAQVTELLRERHEVSEKKKRAAAPVRKARKKRKPR